MAKSINDPKQLLEDMTSNNYHWASEGGPPKLGGKHEIDVFTMLASKVDALFQKVDQLQSTPLMLVPLVVHSGSQVFVKYVESKAQWE